MERQRKRILGRNDWVKWDGEIRSAKAYFERRNWEREEEQLDK